jgi:glycosyltransferase involved in cell wall biosynthesis
MHFRRRYGLRAFLTRLIRLEWLQRLNFWPHPDVAVSAPAIPRERPFGVNVIGYVTGAGSLGEVARSVAACLETADVPIALCDQMVAEDPTRVRIHQLLSVTNPLRYNLLVSGAAPPTEFGWQLGNDYLAGRYNIAYWPWENEVFPDEPRRFVGYDEIWTPSTFVQKAIARVSPVPVEYVPHAILPLRNALAGRPRVLDEVPPDAYLFLFVFNYSSDSIVRKNPEGVIEAFRRAFRPEEKAWLVIKSFFPYEGEERDHLRRRAGGLNLRVLDEHLQREDLEALMGSCDCYVSLHRGEGFGLTMAEAMSLGKPVIATNFSGNTDYMTSENSYPVDYELRPVSRALREAYKTWLWADPDLDQAAALMRRVYEDRESARKIGERARADVERMLSPRTVGAIIRQRLAAIEELLA